jgi:uncharacterized protein with von Willebrand factor type A (vWA) domain
MQRHLTKEEMEALEEMDFDELMKTLQERLATSRKSAMKAAIEMDRHRRNQPLWPFRLEPQRRAHRRQVEKQEGQQGLGERAASRIYDNERELGTRNLKIALRRLRQFARDGAEEELDLDGTIRATANKGYLDVQMRPERRNAMKVLVFFDVGGSMDPYIELTERLFSAASGVFKNLEYFYFHNCPYEACGSPICAAAPRPRR